MKTGRDGNPFGLPPKKFKFEPEPQPKPTFGVLLGTYGAKMPVRSHTGDLGYDVFLCSETPIRMPVGSTVKLPTGISIEWPEGYGAIMKSRSSLGSKGLLVACGVIDSGYRGELIVVMTNTSKNVHIFQPGDKIAQFVLHPVPSHVPVNINGHSEETDRSDGGFGSTGN